MVIRLRSFEQVMLWVGFEWDAKIALGGFQEVYSVKNLVFCKSDVQ
jgi:hypothetical protein